MYVNGDRLVVISGRTSAPGMQLTVYDIKDREKPVQVKTLAWVGNLAGSRMIGDYAYLVMNMPAGFTGGPGAEGGDNVILPRFTENGRERVIAPEEINFFEYPDYSYRYTVIMSVNVNADEQKAGMKTFLTGTSQNIYASTGNLYLSGPNAPDLAYYCNRFLEGLVSLVAGETSDRIMELVNADTGPGKKMLEADRIINAYVKQMDYAGAADLEEKIRQLREKFYRDMARERNNTSIYKFALSGQDVEYRCRGVINGKLLNQFSMDEQGGCLRVAATSDGFLFMERQVSNNVYIMDESLNLVGKLEGLAPTERIYSARFMGNRVYLVTFRRVDPLFVIDLSQPASPKVLGELKIPGFSDYLHPYDENHLIGVGKEVPESPEPMPLPIPLTGVAAPRVAPEIIPPMPPIPTRQQGVKIALFDVSDPARPVEMSKFVVDRPGSDSEVSRNHKAFLFSKSRNLMALPVTYPEQYGIFGGNGIMPRYTTWQGMYVFSVSPEQGISLKGRIEHRAATEKNGYQINDPVSRAAYIEDIFYTISDGAVRLSRIGDLGSIKVISLPKITYTDGLSGQKPEARSQKSEARSQTLMPLKSGTTKE